MLPSVKIKAAKFKLFLFATMTKTAARVMLNIASTAPLLQEC